MTPYDEGKKVIEKLSDMDELTAKRLAVIRHLYEKGKSLSYEAEPINGLCLLPFHDSVEMFMKLCADVRGITVTRNTMFGDYFTKITDLQDKVQMEGLNARRVSLKHHGQLPSSLDVETARVYVTEFFSHNMPVFFGCQLDDVSLDIMIVFPSVRNYLAKYKDFLDQGKYGSAQAYCKIAFQEFLNCYHEKHNRYLSLCDAPGRNARYLRIPHLEEHTDRYLDDLKEDILKINEAITVMNMGVNYFFYDEFMNHGVHIQYWPDEEGDKKYEYYVDDEARYKKETTERYYKFVIETVLKLQDSDVFV